MLLRIAKDTAIFTDSNSYVTRSEKGYAVVHIDEKELVSDFTFEGLIELYDMKEDFKTQNLANALSDGIGPAMKQAILSTQQRFEI